jgi:hypothetical protein
MVAAQLSLTRRALLAGACAAPLAVGDAAAGRQPEPVSGSSSPPALPHRDWTLKQVQGDEKRAARWRLALDRFHEADARLAAAAHGGDEGLYDRLGARHDAAIKALLRAPAPTLVALAFKVDLLISQQAWEMTGGELCLGSLRRDVCRFARG